MNIDKTDKIWYGFPFPEMWNHMKNINILAKIKQYILPMLVLSIVLGTGPQVRPVEAFSIGGWISAPKLEPKVENVVERPTLFAPDRYVIRTETRTVTAYSSTPDQTDSTPFHTAIGSYVRPGIVAANWLPIGTMIRFVDYDPDRWYVVEDRMHPRFSDRTDIWMETRPDAQKFGKRRLVMEIVTPTR